MPGLLFIAGLVASAMMVAGCTADGDRTPPVNVTAAPTVILNGSTNGSTIAVPLNTTLTLELDENPSTGYSWKITATSGLRVVADEYVPRAANASIVGAGGTHRWEIVAVATGIQEISGTYARPWENPTDGAATYRVTVSVTP